VFRVSLCASHKLNLQSKKQTATPVANILSKYFYCCRKYLADMPLNFKLFFNIAIAKYKLVFLFREILTIASYIYRYKSNYRAKGNSVRKVYAFFLQI